MDIGQVVQNVIKQRTPLPCNATAGHSTYKHALYAQCSWTEQWWPLAANSWQPNKQHLHNLKPSNLYSYH